MCVIEIEWVDEIGSAHTGTYGLISDTSVLDDAKTTVEEPHLWFEARDGRIFGIPSKDVHSIREVIDG